MGHFERIIHLDNTAHNQVGQPICVYTPRQIVARRN
jgi:hypothetical protein